VTQWHYRPTILNGQPVEIDTYITVIYHAPALNLRARRTETQSPPPKIKGPPQKKGGPSVFMECGSSAAAFSPAERPKQIRTAGPQTNPVFLTVSRAFSSPKGAKGRALPFARPFACTGHRFGRFFFPRQPP